MKHLNERGGMNMMNLQRESQLDARIGERVTNCLNGKLYTVKVFNKEWVLLEAEDGSGRILTGRNGLRLLYRSEVRETAARTLGI